jgi:hypothetical protein|tara:strand:+ start:4221 stop:4745 length:525 start_codon:yes stop_codon:yes gene_type:complete
MSKKVIHGNTKEGISHGYSFEFKKRTTDNTKMYHMALYRQYSVNVGGRQVFEESKQIKLYTPKDYDDRFNAKVIMIGSDRKRDLANADWLKGLSRADGKIGYEMLFNPTLDFKTEGEESTSKESTEFEFNSKSQVTQANVAKLRDYCEGHYQLHEYEGKSGADLKKLIIEKLNF